MSITYRPGLLIGIVNRPDSRPGDGGSWCPRCHALVIVRLVHLGAPITS